MFKVESPTPKSAAACGRVSPLVVAMRTTSRRNSSVYLGAILYLLHCKQCSKETKTKTWKDCQAHSSLGAAGFIARISNALASKDMGVNPVSGYYHDHFFVPLGREMDA
ncbi:MAG: hypothetical protein ABJL72_09150, partial [Roseobacter sp.]